ncbi:GNAT family N-acetyltransferase [Paenibacillus methanolicus]|uniref:Ribosomal-protein-alanine N-acetyltransferase n=1 Tax=Paenibacillus methanolicus TaxID=582686 RepID=A0A5S5BQT8_9BACL|nr:GNAT family N-acetyltransferase [Paenibacillus methanolicus]TYP69551.1 ribosomal-protein-alanine N-acetyltransferase [Paenibacillus methanolicus]
MTAHAFVFPPLETERLRLALLTLADAEAVMRHFGDERVTAFMDIPPCRSIAEAEEIIRFHLHDSGCRWGLFDRLNGELIGTCGFHCWAEQAPARAEIGFDLSPAYWGQGLMLEALRPVVAIGFERMELAYIEATAEPANERSARLLAKLGFEEADALREGLRYFRLRRARWETFQ